MSHHILREFRLFVHSHKEPMFQKNILAGQTFTNQNLWHILSGRESQVVNLQHTNCQAGKVRWSTCCIHCLAEKVRWSTCSTQTVWQRKSGGQPTADTVGESQVVSLQHTNCLVEKVRRESQVVSLHCHPSVGALFISR